jgi:hypothetical protein
MQTNPGSRVESRSSKEDTGNKGHCYANQMDIYGNRILSLSKIARKKRKEKESSKKKDQGLEQDKNRIVSGHRASARDR